MRAAGTKDDKRDALDSVMSHDSATPIEIADPFARRLLSKYLGRRKDDITRLRAALASADFSSIERTGHNLFGSGAAYGLDEISALGARLETAARAAQADSIASVLDDLERFVNSVTIA